MIDHMHPSADVDMELEDEQELEEQQEGEIDEEQRAEEEDEKESSEEEDDDEGEEEEKEETAEETPEDADGPDFQGALDTLGDSVDNVLHAPLGPHMGALEAAYNDLYVTLAGKMNALGEYFCVVCSRYDG